MNDRQREVQLSMLQDEQEYIRILKETYRQASQDCENKIRELSARTDLENIQSIVYQQQYQMTIKKQIDEALMNLQNNEYSSMNDYLENCYTNSFTGTLYDLHGQGVPVLFPIDQSQVAKAVQLDSAISVGLYTRLGEDVLKLKDNIRSQVSRGIASGSTWNQTATEIAMGMRSPFNKAYNNAVRIARTEGHRIQNQAQADTLKKAKSKGADVVKQWDSTLDDVTRDTHKQLDGQIRECDEPFEVNGKTAMQPGGFGDPAEDCNCRCCMLQRAKWALDESELRELESRAEYFGLDKAESFEDFKNKYIKSVAKSGESGIINTRTEMQRKIDPNQDRRKGLHFVSDTTFSNLTVEARINGANILRGGEEIEHHLDTVGADASIVGDTILFRKDVCVSEVLEETYHYMQNLNHMNDDKPEPLRTYLNEIDAKEYLLNNAQKYKIPRDEIETTKKQLEGYKADLEKYVKEFGNYE